MHPKGARYGMKLDRKALALGLTLFGLVLTLGGPFLPGGLHLTLNDPPRAGHVTSLVASTQGRVFAGTQAGEVWSLRDKVWRRLDLELGGHPVTAMLGEPDRLPLGTSNGLYNVPIGAPPLSGRVSSLLKIEQGLLVGTGDGVRLLTNGDWRRSGPPANIYTLFRQRRGEGHWLHAGTVGGGALFVSADTPGAAWQPNNDGLPEGVNLFAFATTSGALLLAGTDRGLFWQTRPGQPWAPLHPGLMGRRILSLYRDDPSGRDQEGSTPGAGSPGMQRLWIGSDEGLHWIDLVEQDDALISEAGPMPADDPGYQPPFGVSWIVPGEGGLILSAGAVYQFGPTRLHGWYWVSLLGLVLILVAGWLMPRPEPAEAGKA